MAKRQKMDEAMQKELSSLKKQLPSAKKVKEVAEQQHLKETKIVKESAKATNTPNTNISRKKVRTTFEFPAILHQAAKKASVDEFMTLKDYVILVLKKDLRERGYL